MLFDEGDMQFESSAVKLAMTIRGINQKLDSFYFCGTKKSWLEISFCVICFGFRRETTSLTFFSIGKKTVGTWFVYTSQFMQLVPSLVRYILIFSMQVKIVVHRHKKRLALLGRDSSLDGGQISISVQLIQS